MYSNVFNYCSICGILFIFLATAVQKHLPYSKNMFKFVHDHNATSHFLDDDLRRNFLSYIWVNAVPQSLVPLPTKNAVNHL
jgi:hypothetical protein